MNLQIFFNVLFAGVIAFGVVYNSARVSLSERSHELASLRVLGFTRAEISLILLGELALLTVAALPVGALIGYGLGRVDHDRLQQRNVPAVLHCDRAHHRLVIPDGDRGGVISGLMVRRRLDRLDLGGRSSKGGIDGVPAVLTQSPRL